MDYAEHVAAIERESADVVSGLGAGGLDVRVPTCPDWTLVDLATHLGQFCGFWSHVICEAKGLDKTPYADPGPGEQRPEWFASWYGQASEQLVSLLRGTEPAQSVWTWDPSNGSAAFAARRAAHELAIHRFDVQSARGSPEPVAGPLAVDGIEEIFAMLSAWRATRQEVGHGEGESLHLHAGDPEAEWTIVLRPEETMVERTHRKADMALRGSASDLELVLYDRPPLGPVERFGDERAMAAWRRAFSFG